MPVSDAAAKAQLLHQARASGVAIAPFTDTEPEMTLPQAYAVQNELTKLLLAQGERVVGYKVGLTSKAVQRSIGADGPDLGPVLASAWYRDGQVIDSHRLIQPRLETEIAFVLSKPLTGPGVSVLDAALAIGGMCAAFEIVDSRIADWRIKLADTISDLASNAGLVTSSRVVQLAEAEPRLVGVTLTKNGIVQATGAGAAALGDPIAVLAWLANTLGGMGVSLEPGQVVLTGALHPPVPMVAGDVFRAEFDRLGPLTVTLD